jgi:hypothetical protein
MNTRISQILILVSMAVAFIASSMFAEPARAAATPEQQVLQEDANRFAAMVKGDLAALDRLLAIELTYIHSNARLEDKHAFLYGIKSGGTKYLKIIPTERQAHVMGNVAVITGVAAVHVVDRGQDLDITIRYTDVHVLRGGRWQMVSWQATRLVPSDKVIPGGPA